MQTYMTISRIAKLVHENAKNKGFWDRPSNTGEKLMLIVSEIGEAMESDRKGIHYTGTVDPINDEFLDEAEWELWFKNTVKDTFEDEMADAVIRILDLCESKDIDIEWHIKKKMRYNSTRPHMHGKKY